MKEFTRNEKGLLTHINYLFNDDGQVDWRKMIPSKYLYPNIQKKDRIEKIIKVPINQYDPTKHLDVPDDCLCILLSGIRHLAILRGCTSLKTRPVVATQSYACVTAEMTWIPNFELTPLTFGDSSSAHPGNVSGFGIDYLVEVATNRAFCRAVRNYLNINIVSKEELSGKEIELDVHKNNSSSSDLESLKEIIRNRLKKNGFLSLKEAAEAVKNAGAGDFTSYAKLAEVPEDRLFELAESLKGLENVKKAKN